MNNYSPFYEKINDIVIIIDSLQIIHYINPAAEIYFSCQKETAVGLTYKQACKQAKVTPVLKEASCNKSSIPVIKKMFGKTSSHQNQSLSWQNATLPKKNGQEQFALIGYYKKKTNSHKNSAANKDNADTHHPQALYLKSLLEANLHGLNIYWFDRNSNILLCNNNQAKSVGFPSADNLIGKSVQYILNSMRQPDPLIIKETLANNHQVINQKKSLLIEETSFLEGKERVFLSYKAPFFNEDKEVIGLVGISTDITEKKQLENQVKETKSATDFYLESILMSSQSSIYWMDKEGVVLGCNDQQAKSFGLKDRMDAIGKNTFTLGEELGWDPKIAKEIRENDLKIMQTCKPLSTEESITRDGKLLTVLSSKVPLVDKKNNVIGVMGISTDITEQKNLQKELAKAKKKAEQQSNAKSQFIANMCHDVRTPLVGIQGTAEYLAQQVPLEFRADLKTMHMASLELLELFNDIIEFTRLEHEQDKPPMQAFNLRRLLTQLEASFSPLTKRKGLDFSIDYPNEAPDIFIGIRVYINRILLNLLSNALKFTHQGFIKLKITAQAIKDSKQWALTFTLTDSGIGIAKEKQELVFESFHRVQPTYLEDSYTGSGLGLAIVKKFVNQMKGTIELQSELDQGSTFTINLKLTPTEQSKLSSELADSDNKLDLPLHWQKSSSHIAKPITTEKQALNHQQARFNILLVEDNELIKKITVRQLNAQQCFVELAKTAKEALHKIKQQHFDLIFMDIGLPDIDGISVIKTIRQWGYHPNTLTPIYCLTAHLKDNIEQHTEKALAIHDIITKPITDEKIKLCLKAADKANQITEVIDFSVAQTLYGGKLPTFLEMFCMQAKLLPNEQDKMRQAYKSKNWKLLHDLAHSLHGSAHYAASTQLAKKAHKLEDCINLTNLDMQDSDNIAESFNLLMEEIDVTLEVFNELKNIYGDFSVFK